MSTAFGTQVTVRFRRPRSANVGVGDCESPQPVIKPLKQKEFRGLFAVDGLTRDLVGGSVSFGSSASLAFCLVERGDEKPTAASPQRSPETRRSVCQDCTDSCYCISLRFSSNSALASTAGAACHVGAVFASARRFTRCQSRHPLQRRRSVSIDLGIESMPELGPGTSRRASVMRAPPWSAVLWAAPSRAGPRHSRTGLRSPSRQ